MPTQQGFLAPTASELVFLKKKRVGTSPSEVLHRWPRSEVELSHENPGAWSYPGLGLAFSDGTSSMVFGEKRWGLDLVAAAAAS